MHVGPWVVAVAAVGAALGVTSARAGDRAPLTLDRVVELARTCAYPSRFAALDVDDARARLAGAQALMRDNPTLSGNAGPRLRAPVTIDGTLSIGVPIELGLRRARAIDVAEHEVRREQLHYATALRAAVQEAVGEYPRALHAAERRALADERRQIAEQLVATAGAREQAGDASRFEVNLARAELARALSQALERDSAVEDARAALARILATEPAALGPLHGTLSEAAALESLQSAIGPVGAPSVSEARAELDAAHAAVALAETTWWPDVSAVGSYALDDGDHTAAAGLSLTLPVFSNGQGDRRAAAVRVERGRLWRDATQSQVELERARGAAALERATAAERVLADDGLPRAIENEGLAREAYRAGKLDLASYVVLRRESLETREEHLDRLLEKGLAALAVATSEADPRDNAALAPQGEPQ